MILILWTSSNYFLFFLSAVLLKKEMGAFGCSYRSLFWVSAYGAEPFDVVHEDNDLNALVKRIKSLPGETRVVMEYTGNYYEPIVYTLHNAGIYVSAVNAILVHNYGGQSDFNKR